MDDDTGTFTAGTTVTVDNVAPSATAAGDTIDEDEYAVVSGAITDPGSLDSFMITIDWGDGGPTDTYVYPAGTLAYSETHRYLDDDPSGTASDVYTVTVTVMDDDTGTFVTVDNVAPTVDAGADQIVDEGDTASFLGVFTDPGADTWAFEWTFGDGNEASGTLTPDHAYGDNGVYTVTLTVEDDDGGVGTDTLTVTVLNVPPEADAGPDMTEEENIPLTFTGSATDPGSGDTHTYEWDLDYDGSTFDADYSGQEVTHTWTDDWEGTVALRVTDDEGGWDIDTLHATISNVAPEAYAGEPQTPDEGATVAFSGSASDQSPDDILSYTWDFGDGSPTASGTLSPEHVYADDGVYTVTLTVEDDDGGAATCTTAVTVVNVAPSVNAGEDQTVYVGSVVQFEGSFTDPGDDTHTVTWEFGDGGSETGTLEPAHAYASDGEYLVTLTVADDDGGVGSDQLTVHAMLIRATVDLDPATLNLMSKGRYVTCYIELQEGFDPSEVDISTVRANGVPAAARPKTIDDHDGDGVPDLMVKFRREALQGTLVVGDDMAVYVTGELFNGFLFDGCDAIRVIDEGGKGKR
jgi:PKD repeat protein